MKTNKEMRDEAWAALFKRRWFARLILLAGVIMLINSAANVLLDAGCRYAGVLTVTDYWVQNLLAKTMNTLPPPMPTQEAAYAVFAVSLFVGFVQLIFSGITAFALARATLRAARGEDEGWFTGLLDGFKQPFGMMSLAFYHAFMIFLWTLVLVFPGIIAFYRYRFAWRVKSDHPDWSAGACLAESVRLTAGRKWALFKFDCSYWKILAVFFLVLMAHQSAAVIGLFADGALILLALAGVLFIGALLVGLALTFIVPYYMMLGASIFYREILDDESRENGV